MIYIRRAHAPKGYDLRTDDGGVWAHMASDTGDDELVKFANQIGLKRAQLQRAGTEYAHFDLTRGQTDAAIRRGAKPLTGADFTRQTVYKRKKEMSLATENNA